MTRRSPANRRKKSLPVVAALSSRASAGRELARCYRQAPDADPNSADPGSAGQLAELVEAAGGRRRAANEDDRRLDTTLTLLADLSVHTTADTSDLRTLAVSLVPRDPSSRVRPRYSLPPG